MLDYDKENELWGIKLKLDLSIQAKCWRNVKMKKRNYDFQMGFGGLSGWAQELILSLN